MRRSYDVRARSTAIATAFLCGLWVAGCGNGGNEGGGQAETTEGRRAASGSATLEVGGEAYRFDRVLCAFGPEETRREDTEFVLSAIQDGLQLDATIHTDFGHVVTLDDIEDFENPRLAWSAGEAGLSADRREIIRVDGKRVSATATFTDGVTGATSEGTLTAVCP